LADAAPKKERVFLGSAVKNGVVRFTSVSQIVLFDPHSYGGCPRRWAYRYKWQMGKEESDQMKAGSEVYATSLEDYLKTGVDKLVPVLRPAKHFFPKPGPDIEVEQRLGDMAAAIALREQALRNGAMTAEIADRIRRVAGLAAAGVPIDGAADYRHRRGEYVDGYGQLKKELVGVVAEIADLKTVGRIDDHVTRSGTRLKGTAKTVEQILAHTQMVGYGVHACDKWSDLTHVRLSHIYAQTKHGFAATKRTGVLEVGEVRRRWARQESVVRQMIDVVATADKPEQVPTNIESCNSYNRECPHSAYCSRPNRTVADILQIRKLGEKTMGNGFFDTGSPPAASQANGASAPAAGFFAPTIALVPQNLPPAPPPVQQTEEERAATIAAAKAAMAVEDGLVEGFDPTRGCNGNGFYQDTKTGYGFFNVEPGHVCSARCKPKLVQQPPQVGQVNPPDSPPRDPIAEASPLPAEVVAAIPDLDVRAAAAAHAEAHNAREAAAEAANPKAVKTSGKCLGGKQEVALTPKQLKSHKVDCPVCGKEMRLKDDDFSPDFTKGIIPGHMMPKMDATPAPTTLPPASAALPPPPAPAAELPPAPVATLPPPPVEVPAAELPPAPAATLPPPPPVKVPAAASALPPVESTPPTLSLVSASYLGYTLYLDVIFDKGEQPPSLNAWCDDLVSTLEKRNQLDDVRLAPNTTDLGYGKWRAALAAMAKVNAPSPGDYVITGYSVSELRQAIVEGLQTLFGRVRRGSGR
jgi:hypothetical protein